MNVAELIKALQEVPEDQRADTQIIIDVEKGCLISVIYHAEMRTWDMHPHFRITLGNKDSR